MNAGFATEDRAVQICLLQETSLVVCASEIFLGFRRHSDILSSFCSAVNFQLYQSFSAAVRHFATNITIEIVLKNVMFGVRILTHTMQFVMII